MRRIGLFGGTFDPVHFGHLRPALELTQRYQLSEMHLLPNHRPVHRDRPAATTLQRIEMLELATADQPALIVDTQEALRDKPSYSIDTLTAVHEQHPDAALIFFMGGDTFSAFDTWHRWQDILEIANLVVVDRPGAKLSAWSEALIASAHKRGLDDVTTAKTGAIERCNVTQLAISATAIRQYCFDGQSIQYLLPEAVREYIVNQNLYR